MRAMVLDAFGTPLVLREVSEPTPAAHEVVVSIDACGVCGTDLKLQKGAIPGTPVPIILGHEIAGHVIASGGPEGESLIGRSVAVPLSWNCGACEACRRGADQFCSDMIGRPGFTVDGGLQDVLCVPARMPVVLPDALDPLEAALLADCISTVHHAIERAGVVEGERVLIIGAGGLGVHALQLLDGAGAVVSVSEPDATKRQLAIDRGAVAAYEPAELEAAPPAAGSFVHGYEAVFDFVGTPSSAAVGLDQLVPGGRLVLVGYTPGSEVSSPIVSMVMNERQVLASRSATRADLIATSAMLADGAIDAIVSRAHPLEAVNDALADLADGAVVGRSVIDMSLGR